MRASVYYSRCRRLHAVDRARTAAQLRLCDGEMPVMGKVYDRMFMLVENTKASGVLWASSAVTAIEKR